MTEKETTGKETRTERKGRKLFSDSKPFLQTKFRESGQNSSLVDRVERRRRSQIPKQVVGLRIKFTPMSVNGRSLCRAEIDFTQENDPNFAGANVWVKGYMTENSLNEPDETGTVAREETLPFELKVRITRSPCTTMFEATSEDVVIGVEAVNKEGVGAGIEHMPIIETTLI
jgi:hypothetical protein